MEPEASRPLVCRLPPEHRPPQPQEKRVRLSTLLRASPVPAPCQRVPHPSPSICFPEPCPYRSGRASLGSGLGDGLAGWKLSLGSTVTGSAPGREGRKQRQAPTWGQAVGGAALQGCRALLWGWGCGLWPGGPSSQSCSRRPDNQLSAAPPSPGLRLQS